MAMVNGLHYFCECCGWDICFTHTQLPLDRWYSWPEICPYQGIFVASDSVVGNSNMLSSPKWQFLYTWIFYTSWNIHKELFCLAFVLSWFLSASRASSDMYYPYRSPAAHLPDIGLGFIFHLVFVLYMIHMILHFIAWQLVVLRCLVP